MSNPIVFSGCEAYVCEVLGKRRALVWLRDPRDVDFDKDMTVELDLSANPSEKPTGIEVDSHATALVMPGLTTLGPQWPEALNDRGGVWLTKAKFEELPLGMTNRPAGSFAYQWETLLYMPESTAPARRYSGYRVELLSRNQNEGVFRVWNALDVLWEQSNVIITVNLLSPAHVDAAASDNFTTVNQKGKLFVNWNKASEYSNLVISPKLPIGDMQPDLMAKRGTQR
jgi:hypothetical protein